MAHSAKAVAGMVDLGVLVGIVVVRGRRCSTIVLVVRRCLPSLFRRVVVAGDVSEPRVTANMVTTQRPN